MVIGLLVLLGMLMGTAALVSLTSGDLLSAVLQNSNRDARATAESGADAIIATFNAPENRKLLVAAKAMDSLSRNNSELRSPCVSVNGERPGGDGRPSEAAVTLARGTWTNLVSGSATRRFRLTRISYATGSSGSNNRREFTVSTAPGQGIDAAAAAAFTANRPNLNDPDGVGGNQRPGHNRGYIALTVEGSVTGADGRASISTITREYEVLAKCCGASFGSGGAGGARAASTNLPSIGADSRLCNLELGIILGLNGGDLWSFEANDRYTTTNEAGQVVSIPNILGMLNPGETIFERSNYRVTPHSRTFFTTDKTTDNPFYSPDEDDVRRGGWIQQVIDNNYSCSGITLGRARIGCYAPINCKDATRQDFYCFGQKQDLQGLAVSGIPVIATDLELPSIGSFKFSWPSGSGANGSGAYIRTRQNDYAGQGVFIKSNSTNFKYVIRTNNDPANPRVEVCQTTTGNPCTAWTQISDTSLDPNFASDGDNFQSASYGNKTGPDNLWSSTWSETGDPGLGAGPQAGLIQILPSGEGLQLGNSTDNANADNDSVSISRTANLTRGGASIPNAQLNFIYQTSAAASPFRITVRAEGQQDFTRDVTTPSSTDSNYTVVIPPTHVSDKTTIKISNLSRLNKTFFRIKNLTIGSQKASCRYTTSSPRSNGAGFHCLGPSINLVAGGQLIVDTTGGPLSFYYVENNDNRGVTLDSPVIQFGTTNSSFIKHVRCETIDNNCDTDAIQALVPLGYPDRLNFFGRDPSSSFNTKASYQFVQLGVRSSNFTPGKIAGVWIYFPMGHVEIATIGCGKNPATEDDAKAFWAGTENWNYSGRIWAKTFRPCGLTHIRVPRTQLSSLADPFGGSLPANFANEFVGWLGTDWVARSVSGTSNY